jgi:hypothetical protein
MKKKLLRFCSTLALLCLFGKAIGQNPIPNYDFETWRTDTIHQLFSYFTYNHPTGWNALACAYYWGFSSTPGPISCYKSTDKYSGNYALNLNVNNDSVGADVNAYFPLGYRPLQLNGYYKCNAVTGDSSIIQVEIIKGNSYSWSFGDTNAVELGSGKILFAGTSVSTYQPFSIPIVYKPGTDVPDSAMIMISSTNKIGISKPGQQLWIDDLSFSGAVGVDEDLTENNIYVYPNPASDHLTIDFRNKTHLDNEVEIFDVVGKNIIAEKINANSGKINIASLENGIYIMRIKSNDKVFSKKFIKN